MQNYIKFPVTIFAMSLILTMILYVIFVISDLITGFSNAPLLLNIDFLVNYKFINIFEELLVHFLITLTIVCFTTVVYLNFYKLKFLYLSCLMIIFIMLYPLLILLSKRQFFHYEIGAHIVWLIAHLMFIVLLNFSVKKLIVNI
ncbi:hypothetical protein HpBTM60_33880 [Helicobacter pylori]